MNSMSADAATVALMEILDRIRSAEAEGRLREALDNSGNDMLRRMQYAFPILTQIQMEIIQKHGFPPDGEGLVKFTQEINSLEKDIPEIRRLNEELRAVLIPPLPSSVALR